MNFIHPTDFMTTIESHENWASLLQGAADDLKSGHKYICYRRAIEYGRIKLFLSNKAPRGKLSLRDIKDISDEVSRREPSKNTQETIAKCFTKIVGRKEKKLSSFQRILDTCEKIKLFLLSTYIGWIIAKPLEFFLEKQKLNIKSHTQELSALKDFSLSLAPYKAPESTTTAPDLFPADVYQSQIFPKLSGSNIVRLGLVTKKMQQFVMNARAAIVNNQFLPIEHYYPCKTSAAVRECAIAQGLTSIKCERIFLKKEDLMNICKRLQAKKLYIKKLGIPLKALDEDMLPYLHQMSHLSLKHLDSSSHSDAAFVRLNALSGLTHLSVDLYGYDVDSYSLFSFKSLKSLSITGVLFCEKSFPPQSNLGQLEHFTYVERLRNRHDPNYIYDYIYEFFDQFLSQAKNLQSLTLSSRRLDSNDITKLTGLKKLKTLDLSDCESISNMVNPLILSLENLTTVTLTGTDVSERGIQELRDAGKTVIFEGR